jgi:MinD superfamily P-loop ATPase
MRIAVASGKGGTGKTTVATSLAFSLAGRGEPVAYLDCDVEEPNGHILLEPRIHTRTGVSVTVPEVDVSSCVLGRGGTCRACSQACRFSAILALKDKVLTFPKLCHGCGGCILACPEQAIREGSRQVGRVETGKASGLTFVQGLLDIGEAMAPPVIQAVLAAAPAQHTLVIDSPPGTTCPVIESVRSADAVLLVAEPTPFGLNDLEIATHMVRRLGLPFAVAINRAGIGDSRVHDFCRAEGIRILLELPDDRRIAEAYSRGETAVVARPDLAGIFLDLSSNLGGLVRDSERARPRIAPVPQLPRLSGHAQDLASADMPTMPSEGKPPGQFQSIPELVVISGKGGTGKTSLVASFFALATEAVVADCDVDAADLHLVMAPEIQQRWPFSGGYQACLDPGVCTGCNLCLAHCRFSALQTRNEGPRQWLEVDPIACEGCGVCVDVCPEDAVGLTPSASGEWFLSETRHGPMVHARLGIAQANSGKLVTLVRREARAVAETRSRNLLLVDGSPGIGCPVIASITGAQMVLVVTEPTLAGIHDMGRVAELTKHFQVETTVCINKADINPELTRQMEAHAAQLHLSVLGRIRYDPVVTQAQLQGRSVVEYGENHVTDEIRSLWERIQDVIS